MAITPRRLSKSITIEDPILNDDIDFFYTNRPLSIKDVHLVIQGSATPSVTPVVASGTTRGTPVTTNVAGVALTNVTTGVDSTITNAAIPDSSFVWIDITAQSGTVDALTITMFYTEE